MIATKNIRLIDFLWENGILPDKELFNMAYYTVSEKLLDMMDRYYIQNVCIPNKGGNY